MSANSELVLTALEVEAIVDAHKVAHTFLLRIESNRDVVFVFSCGTLADCEAALRTVRRARTGRQLRNRPLLTL